MIDWEKVYEEGDDFRLITPHEINEILEHMQRPWSNKHTLDIGCGTGQLTRELWHRGLKPTGIDIAKSATARAKSYTILGDEISYFTHNIETEGTTTFGDRVFSLITCKLVYAFIEDKHTFLKNIAQLLDPHGVFVIITPLKTNMPPERQHIAVDYKQTLDELTSHFEVSSSEASHQVTFFCTQKDQEKLDPAHKRHAL